MNDDDTKKTVTLTDDEIESEPAPVDRRSALAIMGGGVFGAIATALTGCGRRRERVVYVQQPQPSGGTVYVAAQPQPQPVIVAQPAQPVVVQQPGVWRSGVTDNDSGPYADPAGNGRGPRRGMQTGLTDGDPVDPAGYGRGTWGRGSATGITDGDSGTYADPAGNGRGPANPGYTGITDSDPVDQAGHGRGHR